VLKIKTDSLGETNSRNRSEMRDEDPSKKHKSKKVRIYLY